MRLLPRVSGGSRWIAAFRAASSAAVKRSAAARCSASRDPRSAVPKVRRLSARPLYHHVGEALHIRRNNVWLVRGAAKGQLATVDECRIHAGRLSSYAIEGLLGDEKDFVHSHVH